MKKGMVVRVLLALTLSVVVPFNGCGTVKSVYKTVRPEKTGFKKKVLVLPVMDQAGLGEAKIDQITDTLVKLLKEDEHLLVQKSPNAMPSTTTFRSPKFGIITDPDLAKQAEEMGVNAMITSVLSPFEWTSRKIWIWPFRRVKHEVTISMFVNALDIINGTLFLTNLETRKIKRKIPDDLEEGEEPKKEIDPKRLEEELSDILKHHAEAIIEKLVYQPWSGRILSANSKKIIFNAGKDVGIHTGTVFDVFGRGDSIRSISGRTIYLLGPKLGEIKTVKVSESYSSAVPLTGGQFKAGQVIRVKN